MRVSRGYVICSKVRNFLEASVTQTRVLVRLTFEIDEISTEEPNLFIKAVSLQEELKKAGDFFEKEVMVGSGKSLVNKVDIYVKQIGLNYNKTRLSEIKRNTISHNKLFRKISRNKIKFITSVHSCLEDRKEIL